MTEATDALLTPSSRPLPAGPWHLPLIDLHSRGSEVEVVGGLAGCSEARKDHQGQFFTPEAVVACLWRLLGTAIEPAKMPADGDRHIRLLDTCAGSGRLLWPARPDVHDLTAIEPDPVLVEPLAAAHAASGFGGKILHGRLELHRISGRFDVALINPPFSLHWDGPDLEAFPTNSYGNYGSSSAATSHWYALEQAADAAVVVGAVVPRSVADRLLGVDPQFSHLAELVRAVVHLPASAFRAEGAEVATSLLVLAREATAPGRRVEALTSLDPAAVAPIAWRSLPRPDQFPHVEPAESETGPGTHLLPVTGDRHVRIARSGRRVVLRFACGAQQAITLNAVLRARLSARDYRDSPAPIGVRFIGQGALDLQNYLAQADPLAAWDRFVSLVSATCPALTEDPGIRPWLARQAQRIARETVPMRRWVSSPGTEDQDPLVWLAGQTSTRAVATQRLALPVAEGGAATLAAGSAVEVTRMGPGAPATIRWAFTLPDGRRGELPGRLLVRAFSFPDRPASGWRLLHPGMRAHDPVRFARVEAEARRRGLDRILTWGYQFDDLCEFVTRGRGVCGWLMGMGKARLGISLCLMGGRHNLIVVESRLLDEMEREMRKIGLEDWKVLRSFADTRQLARINLVSYSRLRQPLGGPRPEAKDDDGEPIPDATRQSHRTIAGALRRRIHTLIADEAHLVKNGSSQQTRAVLQIAARRNFDLSGTPIANYPRDVLPLLAHVGGDGTVVQPYGRHHPFLKPGNLESMERSERGIRKFCDLFTVTEWVTNEFLDDPENGASREIPRIADVPAFRRLVAPSILRRVLEEPEVAAHIRIPTPTTSTVVVPWDDGHLAHYVDQVRHFAQWYRDSLKQKDKKISNLAILLVKIGAVVQAANAPPSVLGLTAKQRATLDLLRTQADEGHQTICFVHSPRIADLFVAELAKSGHAAVPFHGGIPIAQRTGDLHRRFVSGEARILIATVGVAAKGLNLPCADRVVFYDRDWLSTVEQQAVRRVLRPQQIRQVHVTFLHHEGSIDIYQDQMVRCKANAMSAGLDYGEEDPASEFLHFETILKRFLDHFESTHGSLPAAVAAVA